MSTGIWPTPNYSTCIFFPTAQASHVKNICCVTESNGRYSDCAVLFAPVLGAQVNHYRRALALARTSAYPERGKRMSAIVVRGGAIISAETNVIGRMVGQGHAEHRALRPHMDLAGTTVIVARANGRCSRPCAACLVSLRAAGVRQMVYANAAGIVVKEKV